MTLRRNGRMDGLRGIAALAVLVIGVLFVQSGKSEIPVLEPALALCYVVSGYLLYRPFATALVRNDRRVDTGAYLRNRVLRLAPLPVLVVGAAFVLDVAPAEDPWQYAALPVFCLVLPLLGVLASSLAEPEDVVGAVALPGVLLTVVGLPGMLLHEAAGYATAFGLGMLAVASATAVTARRTLRRNVWAVRRAAVLFALAGLAAMPATIQLGVSTAPMALLGGSMLVLLAIPGRGVRRWIAGALGAAPLRFAGRRSLGLILWHYPVALAVQERLNAGSGQRFVAAVVITLLAAEVSHRLVEVPLVRARKSPLRRLQVPPVDLPEQRFPDQLAEPVIIDVPPATGKHRAQVPVDQSQPS